MTEPAATLVRFGRALREEGLAVGSGRVLDFCRAASLVAPSDFYWAGRATLVARREDIPVYDRVFRSFFGGSRPPRQPAPPRVVHVHASGADASGSQRRRDDDASPHAALASRVERLRRKRFVDCSPDELAELSRLMAGVQLAVPMRRSRRREAARAGELNLRRTLRRSFRTGGEPVERAWSDRRRQRRRLVLLLDVSGSMAPYSRALVMFAHAALRADRHWEAFCFGTRLTHVTRALASADPDHALHRAAEEVLDWDGGTRIGDSIERFLADYGHSGMARGAVIVICSDGLEVGEPEHLREQMKRLSRLAHRIVWLNPLKTDPGYEPLARGMAAALPYVDVFAAGGTLEGLEEVAAELRRW